MIHPDSKKQQHSEYREEMEKYRGRFAPSPTGKLHFGSLVTALASYLEAKQQLGDWLIRIDDLDQTRCIKGMDSTLLRSLEKIGFEWDETVAYQSQSIELYQTALSTLIKQDQVYGCECSRKQIASSAQMGIDGLIYPGNCYDKTLTLNSHHALRIKTKDQDYGFTDATYGKQSQNLAHDIGDFTIKRRDGFFAYQLAVVMDDEQSNINHIVRGADLLLSTPRQIYLKRLLNLKQTSYRHIPLATDSEGKKLSKRDLAHPVNSNEPISALIAAWKFLQQKALPPEIKTLNNFWLWAVENWQASKIQTTLID